MAADDGGTMSDSSRSRLRSLWLQIAERLAGLPSWITLRPTIGDRTAPEISDTISRAPQKERSI
jgi:hypothetical protein